MKLFPKMKSAVEAMASCCPDDEKEEYNNTASNDNNKLPIARSEVFNETWMLRLTLALIHDYTNENKKFCPLSDGHDGTNKAVLMKRIQAAVTKRWISEGGLEPAFEKEGTTWTDAILGDVRLRGEFDDDDKVETEGNKRKIELADISDDNAGVVIVEAKMGSPLNKSVTNSPDYDQAARNIACLAQLLLNTSKHDKYLENSAVVVFMPDPEKCVKLLPKLDDDQKKRMSEKLWKRKKAAQSFFDNVKMTINNQGRKPVFESCKSFEGIVAKIANNSSILTWDEIIDGISDGDKNKEELKKFYIKALKEIVPKKRKRQKRK